MDTRTPDIRFACTRCGQRIVVDASAAGLETACPGCATPLIIPDGGKLVDRESVAVAAGRRSGTGRATFPDLDSRMEPLESELRRSRGEVTRLQEQVRLAEEERHELQAAAGEAHATRQQMADDLELARERVRALETDAAAGQTRRAADEQALAAARAGLLRLQEADAQHRRSLDETRARLAESEAVALRAPKLEQALALAQDKLAAAIEDAIGIQRRCDELRAQAAQAQRELLETESGRELAALRSRLAELEAGSQRASRLLTDAQADGQRLTKSEAEWRAQFELMRQQRDAAVKQAEKGSQSALQDGNDILRGILDRQKVELDERYAELRRLRRAQLGLRILYALGGLLALAAVVLGVRALPGVVQ